LGKTSELQTPHPEYLALRKNSQERQAKYRALFKAHLTKPLIDEIRKSINRGLALGDERFTSQIEALTKKRVTAGAKGRPRKVEDND
jgi:putative transposase